MTSKNPAKQIHKAAVAFFAGKLIALASDDDRFEAAFVDTDLGGSVIHLDRGLEELVTDADPMMHVRDTAADDTWMEAHGYFCELVEADEQLNRSAEAFNCKFQECQWTGNGPRPVQRRLIAVARNVLRDLYKNAQLPAKAAWQDAPPGNKDTP